MLGCHDDGSPLRISGGYTGGTEGSLPGSMTLSFGLHGLWLVRSGWQLGKAATAVGVHYRTVQTWVGWYREGGVEGVLCHKMAGRGKPRFLSPDQERELTEEVSSGRFKTAGEIRDWIESEYGVSYKSGSVYGLLERLGCSPKVPRGRHEKADVGAQESWKKGASVAPLPERA